jgi:hypothetical protein
MTIRLNQPAPRQVERSVKGTGFRPDIEGLRAIGNELLVADERLTNEGFWRF